MKLSDRTKEFISKNEAGIIDAGILFSNVESFGRVLLYDFFKKNGFFTDEKPSTTYSELSNHFSVIEKYNKFFTELLDILTRNGVINKKGDQYTVCNDKSEKYDVYLEEVQTFKNRMIEKYEDMRANFNLLETCINQYGDVLNGESSANSVLFPMFSLDLVDPIFRGNRLVEYFNKAIALCISDKLKVKSGGSFNILEIGSGTGGTTDSVIEEIKENSDVTLFFTDISKIFLKKAQKRYDDKYSFVKFEKYDVESSEDQGSIPTGEIDVIFASNVVHATKDVMVSIRNIYTMLKKGGVLLLNELTALQDFATLTFGLMDGWWLSEDKEFRLPGSPLISQEVWIRQLKLAGFEHVEVITSSHSDRSDSFSQTLIAAYK